MLNRIIELLLILLLIFTPIAFGAMDVRAFSLMELTILIIIILWSIQSMIPRPKLAISNWQLAIGNSQCLLIFLSLFLVFVLLQMVSFPPEIVKAISPRTYEIRTTLSLPDSQFLVLNSKFPISFVPFATQIAFFKWLTLMSLFLFLLHWNRSDQEGRRAHHLVVVIFLMGVFESLYGMFEFFSGHRQILFLKGGQSVSCVTGTFINHNYFAGYLLMVIPLSVGFLYSWEAIQKSRYKGWRHRLSSLDGKTLLIGFGVIVMILGLLFSASRMGISSLLLSFGLISLLFRDPQKEKRFLRDSILLLGLALLWAAWIGLDAVISRFFTTSEDFEFRWKLWANTFQIFKDFPLFGSGLETFTQVFPMYRSCDHIGGLFTHADNDFLQLISEIGIVGVGILIMIFFFLFFKAISGIRSLSQWDSKRYIGMGGLVGILALMFHSLVERNIQVPANALLYTVLWAMVLRSSVKGARQPRSTR